MEHTIGVAVKIIIPSGKGGSCENSSLGHSHLLHELFPNPDLPL